MRSDETVAAAFRGWHAAARRAGRRVLRRPQGSYLIWQRDDVLTAMRNGEVFGSRQGELMPGNKSFDPYHAVLVELFTPGSSREMLKPIRRLIELTVDTVVQLHRCDAAQVADILCFTASGLACGLPAHVPINAVTAEIVGQIRRASLGGPDVITGLAEAPLSNEEVMGLMATVIRGFMFASFPIKAGLALLARKPDLQQELRENPGCQEGFLEELLRLDGGAKTVSRVATRDVTIGETTIPAGSPVELCVGLVHRDESDSMSGHDLKLDGAHRHWSFGGGPHRCPASHLTRDLLSVFFEVWLAQIPPFEFDWQAGNVPAAWQPKPYGMFSDGIFDGWVPNCVPLKW